MVQWRLVAAPLAAALVAGLAGAAFAQQGDGERLLRTRCGSCHSTEPGQSRVGPHLAGLAGRAAGSIEGARYSSALRESGLVWDAKTLDRFLANPRQAVPGTTMPVGLPDAGQRAEVIDYLLSLPAEGG